MKEIVVIVGAENPRADDMRIQRDTNGTIMLLVGSFSMHMGRTGDTQEQLATQAKAMRELAKRAREVADELTLRVVQVSPYAEQVPA